MRRTAFENKKPAMFSLHGGQIVPARDVCCCLWFC